MKRSDYQACYTYARLKIQKVGEAKDAPVRFAYYYKHKLVCHIELVPEEPITTEAKTIKFNAVRKILMSKDHRWKIIIMPLKYVKKAIFREATQEEMDGLNIPIFPQN